MNIITFKPAGLSATEVRDEEKLEVLKRYLGRLAERIEGEIYGLMRRLSPTFRQGPWRIYEVSNGTIYLAPCVESVGIHVERTSLAGLCQAMRPEWSSRCSVCAMRFGYWGRRKYVPPMSGCVTSPSSTPNGTQS
jgi:hypothetical protein